LGAVDLVLDRCENTAQHSSRLVRSWLLTSRSNRFQPRAFSVMTEPGTSYRYRYIWKQFIAFIFRAYLMTPSIREQVKVNLHPEHMRLLKDVWEHRVWSSLDRHAGRWPRTSDRRYPAKSSDHCGLVDDYDNLEDGEPLS
jgi:hypothetical protein